MKIDFNCAPHKDFELFRYYLNKDMCQIEQRMGNNSNELLGFFVGSLIDMSIVVLFSNMLTGISAFRKLLLILLLVLFFIISSKFAKTVAQYIQDRRNELGKEEYVKDEKRQEMIDKFDNVACVGLLLCESYKQSYQNAIDMHEKNFYLFEIVHQLRKSTEVFLDIYNHDDLYIFIDKGERINSYRANNYINFAKAINEFLQINIPRPINDTNLEKDLDNLNERIKKWKPISDTNNMDAQPNKT